MNNSTIVQREERHSSSTTDIEKYIILGFFVTTLFIGLIGNTLVLLIIAKKRVKRTTNDVFIMNLAVSDLTMIFFIPLQICDLYGKLPANVFTCNFVRPLMTVTFFVSIFTLTSMAVYRCKVILNPLRPEMKELFAFLLIVLIWLGSVACVLPLMIVNQPETSSTCNEDWPSVTHRQLYTAALLVLQYLLPLLIIAVAYMRIGLDLYRARLPRRLSFSFKRKSSGKEKGAAKVNYKVRRRENKQVVKTLATIVIMFALCLLPGQVTWMMADFGDKSQESLSIWFKIGLVLSVFHSCLNPLVYGTLARQFRRGYLKYLSYLLCCCESNSTVQRLRMTRDDCSRTDSRKRGSFGFFHERGNHVTMSTTATMIERTTTCLPRYLRLSSNGNVKTDQSSADRNCNDCQGETRV